MDNAKDDPKVGDDRAYHHGDLQRALVDAARRLLESEGPSALSLRAVSREAGVSPAAPYHHFKDKADLLDAVAQEGWELLHGAMLAAKAVAEGHDMGAALGIAYVDFARENPALYRVMYDAARNREALPIDLHHGRAEASNAYRLVRDTMIERGADLAVETGLELATVAAWCGAHGLAEMGASVSSIS